MTICLQMIGLCFVVISIPAIEIEVDAMSIIALLSKNSDSIRDLSLLIILGNL